MSPAPPPPPPHGHYFGGNFNFNFDFGIAGNVYTPIHASNSPTGSPVAPRTPFASTMSRPSAQQLPNPRQPLTLGAVPSPPVPVLASSMSGSPKPLVEKRAATDSADSPLPTKRTRTMKTDLSLRLPTSDVGSDGKRVTVNVNVGQMTVEELKQQVKAFKLQPPARRNRGELLRVLQEFSIEGNWTCMEPQKQRTHKGQQAGSAPTKITLLREKAVVEGRIVLPPPPVPSELPTDQLLKPKQTPEQRAFILKYAQDFVLKNPILTPEQRVAPQPLSSSEWRNEMSSKVSRTNEQVNAIYTMMASLASSTSMAIPSLSSLPTLPSTPPAHPPQIPGPKRLAMVAAVEAAPLRQDVLPSPPNHGFFTHPPKIALVKIMSHWDPAWSEWNPMEEWVRFNGRFIPFSAFPTHYKKTTHWREDLRKSFSKIKIIATRYTDLGGRDPFWARYSDKKGSPFSITKLLTTIADENKAEANQIRNSYSEKRFAELFSYLENGKLKVMKDAPRIIARHKDIQSKHV
ncbi:hypothetical protein B0H12DRAFT_1239876 [Mycena haematopus]|nr:hypothetical protein B0H12DRAFT_1239876 [Mycena haematopus]